jgi:hypothetical protein
MTTKTKTSDRPTYLHLASYGETAVGGLSRAKKIAIMKVRRATLKLGDEATGYVRTGGEVIYRCRAGLNRFGKLVLTVEDIPA